MLLVMLLGTWGMTVVGTMFSALTVNLRLRDLMLPMLVYPMMIPCLMAAMQLTSDLMRASRSDGTYSVWVRSAGRVRYHLYRAGRSAGGYRFSGVKLCVKNDSTCVSGARGGAAAVRNLYQIFMILPDEAERRAPSTGSSFSMSRHGSRRSCGFFVAWRPAASYLVTKNLQVRRVRGVRRPKWRWRSLPSDSGHRDDLGAASSGASGGPGIARLTSMLICWLMYGGYLMLRRAIDEPTQRARISAVLSIFGFADVVIVW